MRTHPPKLAPGWPKPFGKYELLEKIGSGGMAEVFLARSFGAEGLEKLLVIKKILPAFATRERFVSMFIDEAKIAVSLNHPNIVQTYDFGRVDDDYYIAMEYVEGTDLSGLLRRMRTFGPFRLGDALFLGIELCKGLDYAHRRADKYGEPLGIVHRDISPQNLLISREGNLKIVDFGIAHARTVTTDADTPGVIKGKYSYMSPEQALGGKVDARSDIWSAAVVLFELIYNRPLYKFTNTDETLQLVRAAVLPDLHNLKPKVPDAVEKLLYKALTKEPKDRFQTAREMQVDLHKALFDLGELRDAQTVAAFVREVEEAVPVVEPSSSAKTVSRAVDAKTPPIAGTAASSTSVPGQSQITPATPALHGDALAAEIRRTKKDVVCVAGHVTGFAELREKSASDHWQSLLMELMRIIEAIAFKNKAVVERFNENSFLVLLGLPASTENDAERAVWMAHDLLEAVAGINLNLESHIHVSVSIVLGRALVSQVGKRGYERQLLGNITDLGHQMAVEAMPREILVGGQIYQRVRKTFELAYLKQIAFDEDARYGSGNPSVYRVLRPKSRKERQAELRRSYSVLYGRDLPLKALRERLHKVQVDGRALGIAIEGDIGLGKSALVDEFLRGIETQTNELQASEDDDAWAERVKVLRASATQHLSDTPYAAIRELVWDLLDLDPDDDIRAIKSTIEDTVAHYFPRADDTEGTFLTQALGFFFDVKYPDSAIEQMSAARRRSRVFLSVQRLIEQIATRRPVVIVVEDLQHCDTSSIEFLADFITSRLRYSILLVVTSRPLTEASPALERLLYNEQMQREVLSELSRRDAAAVVRERLGDKPIDKVALDYILDRSGGVPFFIIELVDALKARGVLKVVNGRFTLGGSAHETWLPTSLEAVIAARIDQLNPELKTALRRASILGADFETRDATFLFGKEIVDKLNQLERLEWLQRTRARGDEPGGFRFAHTLTYEVAFRELLWEERMEYHAKLAEHLIAEAEAGRRSPNFARIARHLEGATRHEQAADYYFRAARRSLQASSHIEALRLISRALELLEPDTDLTYKCLMLKETVLSALGHHEERLDVLQAMQELAESKMGEVSQLDVKVRLAQHWKDQRDFDQAMPIVEEVMVRAQTGEHLAQLARAKQLASVMMRETGNAEAALELLGEALMEFNALDDQQAAARALKIIGDTYWQMGRFNDALDAYRDALESGPREQKDLREVISINMGLVYVSMGEYEKGLIRYKEALRSCRAIGFQRREAGILPNLGHLYLLMGEPSRAERTLRRAIRLARQIRDNVVLADAVLTLGVVYLERERYSKARKTLLKGRKLARETEINYLVIHAQLALASLRLHFGKPDDLTEAESLARDAIERGAAAAMIHGVAHGNNLLSLALEKLGRGQEALDAGAAALEALEGGPVVDEVTIYFDQAQLHERLEPDDPELASALLDRAATGVERIADSFSEEERRDRFRNRAQIRRILDAHREQD